MLPVRVSQSLNLQSGAFTVLVFHTVVFLSLIHSCRGQHQVVGPSQPILAMVGEDVILPCHLHPVMDAFDKFLEWGRPDLDPRFVLVWHDSVDLESKKHPSYEGRTSLFTDELKQGNISLKLSKVKLSDEGRYRFFSPQLGETAVQLVVGSVSSPDIQKTINSSSVILQCDSNSWYPEPEVVWLDGEGNLLSAGPTETVRGPDDLYTVSSRVTVEKRHSNNFTCRVQQKDINQTRETHIYVPGEVFEDPSGSSSSAPIIIGSVVGIIMLVLAVVFVVWKWIQNKIRNKKHHEDEETERVREKKSNSISNNSEQESLMGRETDRGQLTAERETTNNVDEEQTGLQSQTVEETQQRESDRAQCAVSEGTELQFSVEGERQTDQPLAEGDEGQEETETKPINERRDPSNPTERQTENNLQTEEDEKIKSTDEVQCLMEEEKHEEQLTAEGETTNNVDEGQTGLQSQTFEETQQRESDRAQCAVSEGTELQFSVEGERQTDQPLAEGDEGQEETGTKPINERRDPPNPTERQTENNLQTEEGTETAVDEERDAPNPAESDQRNKEDETKPVRNNSEQLMEGGQTENNLQTEEEEEKIQSADNETEERETLNDKEKEKLPNKLKAKEREVKEFEKKLSRYKTQIKDKQEQIKQVKEQLEEVERQREQTERKLQSVNREEDQMDPETQKEAAEKHEAVLKDLERKKAQLQKQLEKNQRQLEGIKSSESVMIQKKMKATKEKEEIIKTLSQSDSEEDF